MRGPSASAIRAASRGAQAGRIRIAKRARHQMSAEPETFTPTPTLAAAIAEMEAEASANSELHGGNDDIE